MRQLQLPEEAAVELVAAILRDDIDNIDVALSEKQHPEDREYCKKMRKALIKVLSHYSVTPYKGYE